MTRIEAKRYLLAHAEAKSCPVCAMPVLLLGFHARCARRCGAFVYVNRPLRRNQDDQGWDWFTCDELQAYFWWRAASGLSEANQ